MMKIMYGRRGTGCPSRLGQDSDKLFRDAETKRGLSLPRPPTDWPRLPPERQATVCVCGCVRAWMREREGVCVLASERSLSLFQVSLEGCTHVCVRKSKITLKEIRDDAQ